MQWRKGKGCVPPKGPEVAKCEAPMEMRKGRCVPPKEPEVAKCEHGDVYRKGKGCVPPDHGPETASCDRPFIKIGNGCGCPPGLIQRGHDCRPPTVVVVPPPVVVPVGPGPEGPPHWFRLQLRPRHLRRRDRPRRPRRRTQHRSSRWRKSSRPQTAACRTTFTTCWSRPTASLRRSTGVPRRACRSLPPSRRPSLTRPRPRAASIGAKTACRSAATCRSPRCSSSKKPPTSPSASIRICAGFPPRSAAAMPESAWSRSAPCSRTCLPG